MIMEATNGDGIRAMTTSKVKIIEGVQGKFTELIIPFS
jgi:hypothetical protein